MYFATHLFSLSCTSRKKNWFLNPVFRWGELFLYKNRVKWRNPCNIFEKKKLMLIWGRPCWFKRCYPEIPCIYIYYFLAQNRLHIHNQLDLVLLVTPPCINAIYRHSSIYAINLGTQIKTHWNKNPVNWGYLVILKGRKIG